jgi:DNA-binding NarL/FixJ family response regulator
MADANSNYIIQDITAIKPMVIAYRNTGMSKLDINIMKLLKDFNMKGVNIKEDENLILYLNHNLENISYLVIDIEECLNLIGTDVYDYVHMLSTILSLNGNNASIIISVSLKTDLTNIKEFMGIPEVKSIILRCCESTDEEFNEAISEIKDGRFHVPRRIKDLLNLSKQKKKNRNSDIIKLTPRQEQIVNLVISKGASNKIIAKILKISESTVKLHITTILKKYNLRNRTQLALFIKNDN